MVYHIAHDFKIHMQWHMTSYDVTWRPSTSVPLAIYTSPSAVLLEERPRVPTAVLGPVPPAEVCGKLIYTVQGLFLKRQRHARCGIHWLPQSPASSKSARKGGRGMKLFILFAGVHKHIKTQWGCFLIVDPRLKKIGEQSRNRTVFRCWRTILRPLSDRLVFGIFNLVVAWKDFPTYIYIYMYIYICMIHVFGMIKNDFYMFGMSGNHQLAFFFSFSFLLSSKGCTTRVEHGRDVAVLYSKMLVDHFFDFDKVACWSQADIDVTAYHGKKLQRLYPW
jgi:hypothetical protein